MPIHHPSPQAEKKILVIVGGGFAGLKAARVLAKQKDLRVILIDQKNHHLFQPLLYQVATAGLDPSDIAVPIRSQFKRSDAVQVHLGHAEGVDLERKILKVDGHQLAFDYLILACGAQHNYFAHPEWEPFAPGLKIIEQATEIRRRILLAFEQAENELDPERQKELLTFVVVGGGPTGVELAGAIADISRTVLYKDFKRIDAASARVILVEAMPRLLGGFHADLSARALVDLRELGVEVWLSSPVADIDASGVTIGERVIRTQQIFWGAGVQASQIAMEPPPDRDRAGRVKVAGDFSVPGYPHVFVVGDMASFEMSPGKFLPGLAPAAIQAGKYVAKVILDRMLGRVSASFVYNDKGQMATIGKHRAVVESGRLQVKGYLAWVMWLFVHVFYLVGFKNRITVFLQWTWSYLFSKRGSRLITERDWQLRRN